MDAALHDRKGRGRKAEITDADITWLISKACLKPKECCLSAEFWYPASFTRYIHSVAETEGHPRMSSVSETKLRQILKDAKLRPFKVSYYCQQRDPDFDAKMHDVLVIYKQLSLQFDEEEKLLPFEGTPVHTVSYDEKPGIQAIGTTAEDRPPVPGVSKGDTFQRDYEYVRYGTIFLLAAIDLLTGEAIPLVSETHKSADFVQFLKKLDGKYSEGDKIRLILDNHSAHTSRETQTYLSTVPGRFEFVFTPTHGSWLNLVEGFFSKMTKQMLAGIRTKKNSPTGSINTSMRSTRSPCLIVGPINLIILTWPRKMSAKSSMRLSTIRPPLLQTPANVLRYLAIAREIIKIFDVGYTS